MQSTRTSHLKIDFIDKEVLKYNAASKIVRANFRIASNIVKAKKAAESYFHIKDSLKEVMASSEFKEYMEEMGNIQQECIIRNADNEPIMRDNGQPQFDMPLFNALVIGVEKKYEHIVKKEKELKKSLDAMQEMYVPVKVDILTKEWLKNLPGENIGIIAFMFPTVISTKDLPENVDVQDFVSISEYSMVLDDIDSAGTEMDESTFYVDETKLLS